MSWCFRAALRWSWTTQCFSNISKHKCTGHLKFLLPSCLICLLGGWIPAGEMARRLPLTYAGITCQILGPARLLALLPLREEAAEGLAGLDPLPPDADGTGAIWLRFGLSTLAFASLNAGVMPLLLATLEGLPGEMDLPSPTLGLLECAVATFDSKTGEMNISSPRLGRLRCAGEGGSRGEFAVAKIFFPGETCLDRPRSGLEELACAAGEA